MRYLLLIGSDTKTGTPPSPAQSQATLQAFMRFSEEAQKAGKTLVAERLRPEAEARRVRVKAGQHQVTDGPFAETKEALGGFYLLECASREEALEWAKKVPIGEGGVVDVRPVWQM
ncbi:MAG TPA: YciI family protein [Patescibacteria group bacterium]|nr:YciI family protein [Patescibacteria group bacterium]